MSAGATVLRMESMVRGQKLNVMLLVQLTLILNAEVMALRPSKCLSTT